MLAPAATALSKAGFPMNPQPYRNPPRWWPSRLSPLFIRLYAPWRTRELQQQGITEIEVEGSQAVAQAIRDGHGVLLLSNHSYHYDSYVLIEAGLRQGWMAHFMTAWQVFAMYRKPGQLMLQGHGCFSINREANDTQAFRYAQEILQAGPHPLVIFPEGDIYHSNDRVMPFREGAAALALLTRKKQVRPLTVVPCAMKCFYTVDPSRELHEVMDRLEEHIRWRPDPNRSLLERIYRFGNGFLSLKEVEYLGEPRSGPLRGRISHLADAILTQVQQLNGLKDRGRDTVERIRNLRTQLIKEMDRLRSEENEKKNSREIRRQLVQLHAGMEDLFFVTQLCSYHGDYSSEKPTIERIAETIDKFEEDVFALQSPVPRGQRRAVVRFGEPVEIGAEKQSAASLSLIFEQRVQTLLDEINGGHDSPLLAEAVAAAESPV